MTKKNLTGVDLQRAIAERKYPDKEMWIGGDGPGRLCYDDGVYQTRGVAHRNIVDVPRWHEDVAAAHALLDELVAEGWRYRFSRLGDIHSASAYHISKSEPPAEITTDTDFCTAVGNLYLECVG